MDEIKVSVIVPAYNTEVYIERMIECLLKQTYGNLQLIFIDDGSTDKTADIIKSFTDSRIEYYYQKNAGVSAARNAGLKRATGEKLFFLIQMTHLNRVLLGIVLIMLKLIMLKVCYMVMEIK